MIRKVLALLLTLINTFQSYPPPQKRTVLQKEVENCSNLRGFLIRG